MLIQKINFKLKNAELMYVTMPLRLVAVVVGTNCR